MNAFEVTEPTELLKFLLAKMPERGRNSVKDLLGRGQVFVGGAPVTQFNHKLSPGQRVEIRRAGEGASNAMRGVEIIFEDAHLVVIEKRAGLLSIATELEKEKTAYSILSEHVKRADPKNKIFVLHRLDRETSGLMMFAKSQAVQRALQDDWREAVLDRTYTAVLEGRMEQAEGSITSWLTESRSLLVRSSPTPNEGQKAITHYRGLRTNARFSLVEFDLETGRKNQIRVHAQALGHSIVGDGKYGAKENPLKRLALHARVLAFRHPVTEKTLRFESEVPNEFSRLV
jgi:23S rRNA pseudouridine1911/1915/1917 synthase